jgi:hypothetical protein
MSTEFANYDRVRVFTDRFAAIGVTPGTAGYIVETYEDGAF